MLSSFFKTALCTAVLLVAGLAASPDSLAQGRDVKGKVVDQGNEPVIGATVMVEGTTNGTMTGDDGSFTLRAQEGQTLIISCIGYETQTVPVSGSGSLAITLVEDSEVLEKVVVVAYGQIRAKDFTGSVDAVKVENSPVALNGFTDASEFLRGNVTGLQMGEVSGVGQSPSLQVRGKKNLSGGGSPMIVLDGMIYSGGLNSIDPNNIESISVLKDASSLAAYGSRAADGVIMINTKRGKQGKPVISFSTTQQLSNPTYKHKYFDGTGYIRLRNARVGNYDNLDDVSFMNDLEFKNYLAGVETDWWDLATQTGWSQNYNVGLTGANETFNYAVNFGYSNQNGVMIGNNYARINLSSRLTAKINKYMEAGLTMDMNRGASMGSSASGDAKQTPYGSAYFDNSGKYRLYVDGSDAVTTNPLWSTQDFYERESVNMMHRYNAHFKVDAPWVKGLSYKIQGSYTIGKGESASFTHEDAYPSMASGGNEDGYTVLDLSSANGSLSTSTSSNYVIDNILSYDHDFGKHYVSASLVYTRDWSKSEGFSESASDFTGLGNTLLGWYKLSQGNTRSIGDRSYSLKTDVGYLARLVYSFDDRYHVNASIRRDGSSVFGSDKKWGIFPALGVAWHVTNEKFMSGIKWLDDLKLKASYGVNGSQALSPYGTLSTITMGQTGTAFTSIDESGNYQFLYSQYVNKVGNSELGWQQTTSFNVGIEASFLQRRINWEVNAYKSITTDQITNRTVPIMGSGISSQTATMGRIDNWGLESTLQTVNIRNRDFSWTSHLTFNLNRNKLVYLWGGDNEEDDYTNQRFIGKSLDVIWFYEQDGIIQKDGEGSLTSWKAGYPNVIDQDGNGSLDRYDKVFLGNSKENFRLSLNNTVTWKNLQLYFMLTGTFGGNGYCLDNNTFAYYTHYNFAYANSLEVPYWTPSNPSDTYVSAQYVADESVWRIYNSYANVRLQNVNISYNLESLAKRMGMNSARIYLSGQNLFFIAPYWKLSDPGARSRTGQLMRTFTLGFNFTF